MWWFKKTKRQELWDEEIKWPIGDIEAAHRIREICRSAADSAAKAAMQIAIKMSDELLRDSSVRQIVSLCMSANDLRTARTLFRAIQAPSIREDVLNEHPILRQ